MSLIASYIAHFQEWRSPRRATHRGEPCPFPLSSSVLGGPASADDLASFNLDDGLRKVWAVARSADLFKDATYGQWGLHILSPSEAAQATARQRVLRPDDFHESDLVFGTFYGDSDLLVMTGVDVYGDERRILVALPIDKREDWPLAAESFSEFLACYLRSEGGKYWEVRS